MVLQNALSSLTKDNGAVKDLRDLILLTVFKMPALEKFFTSKLNVQNGDKLGFVGELADIGWADAAGCNPEYRSASQNFAEKTWAIGDWAVPLKWCYEEVENTMAEHALRGGTAIGDLTGTDIMDVIIAPALEKALLKMYHRMAYFGDTAAANIGNSGKITSGVDVELFKPTDGVWKQLFGVATSNAAQRTTIAANNETTTAAQKSKLYTAGTAVGIFEDIMRNADSRIDGMEGAAIYCTESLGKALSWDLRQSFHDTLTWQQVENGIDNAPVDGIKMADYNGYKIFSVGLWDRMIQQYENDGTKLNAPHRAYYGSPKNIFVGTPAEKIMSDLEVWFNKDERNTKAYSAGKLGVLLGEDDLFQIAY